MLAGKFIFLIDLKRVLAADILGFFRTIFLRGRKIFVLEKTKKEKNLLIVSLSGVNYTIFLESLFAKALNKNGYNVFFLSELGYMNGVRSFRAIGGKVIFYHLLFFKNGLKFIFKKLPFVKTGEDLMNFSRDGINIGKGIYALVSRKLKVGRLNFEDRKTRGIVRRYVWRSAVYFETVKAIFKKIKPDLVLANEKGYMGNYEIFKLATEEGIDFIQWIGCQEPNSLIFKRYNKTNEKEHAFSISDENWQKFQAMPWQEDKGREVRRLFENGYGKGEWFGYHYLSSKTVLTTRGDLIRKYSLDPEKKIAVLFSHIMWDANLFYGEDLFENGFGEWIVETVKAMKKNKAVNWILKVHPSNRFRHKAEGIKGEYRELQALKEALGEIPENIKVMHPEDEINPYSLFQLADYGITVRGTIGMEMPCFGKPVLTAGTGRYSGKGFTIDSSSKEEYLEKILHIEEIPVLNEEKKRLALLYSYILLKLRPLKFQSFKETFFSHADKKIELLIKNFDEAGDFQEFSCWASDKKIEDFIRQI